MVALVAGIFAFMIGVQTKLFVSDKGPFVVAAWAALTQVFFASMVQQVTPDSGYIAQVALGTAVGAGLGYLVNRRLR